MTVLIVIVCIILLFSAIGSILHATYFKSRMERVEPYGEMVEVFDGQMHIVRMGSGGDTIVLLPGMGTTLPSADFGPLMRELSKTNTVVGVEYFGMGFSSQTSRARTIANYVEEIRAALSAAGIDAPYCLMPHSISSVYSEYYASLYPDEVKAIISLDGTSTAYIGEAMPGFVKGLLGVAKVQQATGFTSLLAPVTVSRGKLLSYGYTDKEISDLIVFSGFATNDNILEQIGSSTDYIAAANALEYPKAEVPYFKIISRQTYETKNAQIKVSPQEYQTAHLERVGAQDSYAILDGTHYIYLNNTAKIAELANGFLGALD